MSTTVFGQRLKQARMQQKISVLKLATKCGIEHKSMYQYEDEGRYPNLGRAITIAKTLGCSLNWLAGLED